MRAISRATRSKMGLRSEEATPYRPMTGARTKNTAAVAVLIKFALYWASLILLCHAARSRVLVTSSHRVTPVHCTVQNACSMYRRIDVSDLFSVFSLEYHEASLVGTNVHLSSMEKKHRCTYLRRSSKFELTHGLRRQWLVFRRR